MSIQKRSILDQELIKLTNDILRMTSKVDSALERAMDALYSRNTRLAQDVIADDEEINTIRYEIEEECLRLLVTQQPAASDLRTVVAAIHLGVELERIGDHAAGRQRMDSRFRLAAQSRR